MKKLFILFLTIFIACGPSEEEIEAIVSQAVNEATSTTSTSSTTTLQSPVEKCEIDIGEVRKLFRELNQVMNSEYKTFRNFLSSTDDMKSDVRFDFSDVDVEKSWFQFLTAYESILQKRNALPVPSNGSLYQEYIFTFDMLTDNVTKEIAGWLTGKAGAAYLDYSWSLLEATLGYTEWRVAFNELPECSDSNY